MRSRTYLNRKTHYLFISLTLFGLLFSYPLFFLSLLSYISMALLFRRVHRSLYDNSSFKDNIVYSPVSGKVINVRKGVEHLLFGTRLTEIHLAIPWWRNFGLFLPIKGEVILAEDLGQKRLWRFSKASLDQKDTSKYGFAFQVQSKEGEFLGVQLIPCYFGLLPQCALLPGDHGLTGANFGFFPFGGTVRLYLSDDAEILINEDDNLIAGATTIAGLL